VSGPRPTSGSSLVIAIAVTILFRLATCILVSGVQPTAPSTGHTAQFWSACPISEPFSVSPIE